MSEAYLAALVAGDIITQPQLATRESSGLRLPDWLIVVTAMPQGDVTEHDDTARLSCMLTLGAAPREEPVPPALQEAIAQPYTLTLLLRREADGWRVDQRVLFTSLRKTLTTTNPRVTFPAWP